MLIGLPKQTSREERVGAVKTPASSLARPLIGPPPDEPAPDWPRLALVGPPLGLGGALLARAAAGPPFAGAVGGRGLIPEGGFRKPAGDADAPLSGELRAVDVVGGCGGGASAGSPSSWAGIAELSSSARCCTTGQPQRPAGHRRCSRVQMSLQARIPELGF